MELSKRIALKPKQGYFSVENTGSPISHFLTGSSKVIDSSYGLRDIKSAMDNLRIPNAPSTFGSNVNSKKINEVMFDAKANIKILTSQVAMYIENKWRNNIFNQIDVLHDIDNWDEDLLPASRQSTITFLKTIVEVRPKIYPGLGISPKGNLVAAWTSTGRNLTVEFMPNDKIQWIVSQQQKGDIERVVGKTSIERFFQCLEPFNVGEWFVSAKN